MHLAAHPFQRAGAQAAALLRGRPGPGDLTDADLDALAGQIAKDCERAGRLAKGEPGWAWLIRLAGMYPQSPPVHPSRRKHPRPIADRVFDFLGPDPGITGERAWPCWSCYTPGVTVRWGKDRWPLTDPVAHLNHTGHYGGGLPVCRACRIAVWTLPYATATLGRCNLTVTAFDPAPERAITAAYLALNRQALTEGWTDWSAAPDPRDTLWDVIADHPTPAQWDIAHWQADNRNPTLTLASIGQAAAQTLADIHRAGAAEDLRTAARRTARTHPVDLAADPALLATALTTARPADARTLALLTGPHQAEPATAPVKTSPALPP